MPRANYTVVSYKYRVGYRFSSFYGFPGNEQYQGVLIATGQTFAGRECGLTVFGLRRGAPALLPTCDAAARFGTIAVPMNEMHYYLDILRNENPVLMTLDSDRPGFNSLYTGPEPPGEEEGS